ncbi:predicted protein [Histoplasma capsulatum G186AR]|uniref:Uncharacterized protein n=1 Tax=Ajellomyces capsulatus (strain G186AR / H82 / ATCC MYA-2454 / RMSCC 2432) TaxID=447093 RepID=C0NH85_AJECG|nr:uncharacterized protein HCBG_02707 [Histoplasma capsulatum G186AR]EEH09170.1 predicted protein [Histoplasma capsulatum G186AR]
MGVAKNHNIELAGDSSQLPPLLSVRPVHTTPSTPHPEPRPPKQLPSHLMHSCSPIHTLSQKNDSRDHDHDPAPKNTKTKNTKRGPGDSCPVFETEPAGPVNPSPCSLQNLGIEDENLGRGVGKNITCKRRSRRDFFCSTHIDIFFTGFFNRLVE